MPGFYFGIGASTNAKENEKNKIPGPLFGLLATSRVTENYGLIITASSSDAPSEEVTRRTANRNHVAEMFKRNKITPSFAVNYTYFQLKSAVETLAGKAKSNNTSYIYINCHGNPDGLAIFLNGKETGHLSYSELKTWLDKIPGKRVLMIESCHSGAAIQNPYAGTTVFKAPNYYVIAACHPESSAWGGENGGIITNDWCKGAGYDYRYPNSKNRPADTNNDGYVSVTDLCDYTERKYNSIEYQNDMCYPEKSYFPVFGDTAINANLNYYIVEIRTADEKDAGTDADISINIHGDKDETGFISLDTENHDDFERGSTKSYLISTFKDIGTIQSFTIKSDNKGKDPGFKLERVKITDATNNKVYPAISCNQWLQSGHLSHQFFLNMSSHRYYITLTMSDVDGAGTNADINVMLHGSKGNSSYYSLDTENYDDFERGTTKQYEIAVNKDIGILQAITVKSDNSGKDPAMSFKQIVVKDVSNKKVYYAEYGGWLNSSKPSVKLTLTDNKFVYNITARVGDKSDAGTNADVDIKLYGTTGETDFVRFPDDPNRDDFERNSDNKVVVSTTRDIGILRGIGIRHNNAGKGPALYISTVTIKEQNTGNTYRCYLNSWIEGKYKEVKGIIAN